MQKVLVVDPEKCTGCGICESACAFYHTTSCNPVRARIKVVKWEPEGVDIPIFCQQCEKPVCADVCPVSAIRRDEKTGALLHNYDICLGCKMCMIACPIGGISIDSIDGRIIKCDLCDGDPRCAKLCPTKAVEYMRADSVGMVKKRKGAEMLRNIKSLLSGN